MAARSKAHEAHRVAVEYGINDIARFLSDELGRSLTAHIANVSDLKAVTEWANGARVPHEGAQQRLRAAFQIFHELQNDDSSHTVRQWFIGMNPQLNDEAPADLIRDGRYKDVLIAARVYITGG